MSPKTARVLMLTQHIGLGGLERMILNLSRSLRARQTWEPLVLVYDHPSDAAPGSHLIPEFERCGIPIETFSKGNGFSLKAVIRVARMIRTEKIQVIHSHDLGALIYGVGAKILTMGQTRLVHTQHSFVHMKPRKRYRYYERFFTLFVNELITVSDDTKKEYVTLGLSPQKIHVVPNGVSFAHKTLPSASERNARKLELLPDRASESWLLYLARIQGRKGQDHAIRLWSAIAPKTRQSLALLFVGSETEAGRLQELRNLIAAAPDADRIHIIGPTMNPQAWLEASDVFISCSEFEGMPLAPIEAAGAGLPLVLSQIPGHEVFIGNSIQYPLADPAAGAEALDLALRSANTPHGQGALARRAAEVRERYSLDQMAAIYESHYEGRKV